MSRIVLKNIVVTYLLVLILGCGGVTALSALSTVGGAAAGKVIEHTSGYGIQSPHTIIEKVMPTVVTVSVELVTELDNSARGRFSRPSEPFSPPPRDNQFSMGSGFVFHEDGFVVTNWHVIKNAIDNASLIRIGFSNYTQYEAKIFNYDATSDIAILKIINKDNEKFPTITWGSKPKLGGHAIIVGSPIGLDFSVSFGIISAVDRTILRAAPPFVPFVQTDAAMNRGNSGGPLFDEDGEVIGINTLILSPGEVSGGGNIGLGFAIDGRYVQDIITRLANGEQIKWSYIGLSYRLLDRDETKSNGLQFAENVIVMDVSPNGAAYNKLFVKDVIKSLDGKKITHKTFASMIARLAPGTKITLEVLRQDKVVTVEIVLLERKPKN